MHLNPERNQRELVLEPTDETFTRSVKAEEETQYKQRVSSIFRSQSYIDESHRCYPRRIDAGTIVNCRPQRRSVSSILNQLSRLPSFSARDIVLRYCKQQSPLPFEQVYAANVLRHCRKIGEGVYSEVFMYKNEQTGKPVVLKVIPIEGKQCVNGEAQKKFDEILSEIVISSNLAALRYGREYKTPNFVDLHQVRCIQGKYPEHFVDLWELYRENFDTLNDHPDIFDENQLYIVFELENGGQDLEGFQFQNAQQTYSAFLQVAITLAIAEKAFEFEHRDLHWGNILLTNTEEPLLTYTIGGGDDGHGASSDEQQITIPTHGVRATLIDFTFSRMVSNGKCYYNDLAATGNSHGLFGASGDYHFDIYRLMRDRVKNCWERAEPYTNLLWLHYVIDKMINGARYRNTKTKKHRATIDRLMQIRDDLLEYRSVVEFVNAFRDSYYANAGHIV